MKAQELYDRSAPFLKEYDPAFYELYSRDEAYSVAALNIDREKPKPRKDIAVYGDIKAQIWYLYDELFHSPGRTTASSTPPFCRIILQMCTTLRTTAPPGWRRSKPSRPSTVMRPM